ncbi:Defensin-like protein 6 [Bienertia sinuspersici]
MGRKCIVFFMVLLIVFASQGMVQQSEARTCQSQSHKYKGPCVRNHNCGMVCRNEGFTGGRCVSPSRKCYCTRDC